MKRIALVILTIWVSFALNEARSQSGQISISGKVVTADHQPALAATVVLSKSGDTTTIKTIQTGVDGKFLFKGLFPGAYSLIVTFAGFQEYRREYINHDSIVQTIELPSVILQPESRSLSEVKLSASKPVIEHKIDRTVVNVSAMISATGNNALELLEKLPGVVVDPNGAISYKGKSGVLILIDGKQTYLSGDHLASYLKSLQASQLDQVELMATPPAKYEASGNAGIINIKTKKSRIRGLHGSIAASTGRSRVWRTNESVSINYRSGNISLFGNAGYSLQKGYRKLNLQRNYLDPNGDLISVYKSFTAFRPVTHNRNIKAGMDYFLTPWKTVGIVFTGSWSSGKLNNPGNASIYDSMGNIDSTILTDNKTKTRFSNRSINFNYSQQFDSLGKTISFDLDHVLYQSNSDQSFLNDVFYPDGTLKNSQLITDDLPALIRIYSAKTDFTFPFANKNQFESGIKSSYVSTDNAANYFTNHTIDYNLTNQFLYKENINAAYVNFRKGSGRFTFQAGMRLENTNIKGHQLGNPQKPDSNFVQQYTGVFPTAYLAYQVDTSGKHLVKFAYGKRIDRPYYRDLNPFVTIVDKFTNFSGNPYLKPQYSSNYEITYNYKTIFTFSLAYSHTNNYQIETIRQQGDVFISSTTNLGSRIYKAINASATLNPAKWWNCNMYSEAVNLAFESPLFDTYISSRRTYYYFETNNQFSLPENWSIQLSGYYLSARTIGQFVHDPKGALNMGIQKKIMKNKASLRVSASDILRTTVSRGSISNITGATSSYSNDFDNRMITLGFSYNFGKAGNQAKRRNTGSSQSEQNRIK